jgi:hypothetical protein
MLDALEDDKEWQEQKDPKFDHLLDLKFTYGASDLNFKTMKKTCWFNHNPGEAALTTKTDLA